MSSALSLWTVPAAVAGGLLAAVAHEMTHWAVGRLLGRRTVIHWRNLETVWRVDTARLRDRVISLSPILVGMMAGLILLLWRPELVGHYWMVLLVSWAVYTLGGVDDLTDPTTPPPMIVTRLTDWFDYPYRTHFLTLLLLQLIAFLLVVKGVWQARGFMLAIPLIGVELVQWAEKYDSARGDTAGS